MKIFFPELGILSHTETEMSHQSGENRMENEWKW